MALTRINPYLVDLDSPDGITFDNQAGTPTLRIDATEHRVGIGTASPGYLLDVNGDINFGGDLYKNGSAILTNAGGGGGGGGGFDENFQEATIIEIDRQNPIAQTGTVTDRTVVSVSTETTAATYSLDYWAFDSGDTGVGDTFFITIQAMSGWTPSDEEQYRYRTWDVGTILYAAQGSGLLFTSETISPSSEYSWMKLEVMYRNISFDYYGYFEFKVLEKRDYAGSDQFSNGGSYMTPYTFIEVSTDTGYEIETDGPVPAEILRYSIEGSPAYSRRSLTGSNPHFLEWKPTQAFKDYKANQGLTGKQLNNDDDWTLEFLVYCPTYNEWSTGTDFFEGYDFYDNFIKIGLQYGSSLTISATDDYFDGFGNFEHPLYYSDGLTHHYALVYNGASSTLYLYIDGVYTASSYAPSDIPWIGVNDLDWDDPDKDWDSELVVQTGNSFALNGFRFTIGPDCPYIAVAEDSFTPPKGLTDATTSTSFTLALLDGNSYSHDKSNPQLTDNGNSYLITMGDQTSNLKTVALGIVSDFDNYRNLYKFTIPLIDNTASDGTSNTFVTSQDDFAIGDSFTFYRTGVPGVYLGPTESMKYDPLTNSTAISFVKNAIRTSSDGQVALEGITSEYSNDYQTTSYGAETYNNGSSSTAIGYDVQVDSDAVGIGVNVEAGYQAVGLGDNLAVQYNGISIGRNLTANTGSGNIIVGRDITSDQDNLTDSLLLKTGAQKHYNFTLSDYVTYSNYSRTGTIYLTFNTRSTQYTTNPSVPTYYLFELWKAQKHAVIYGTVVASISDDNGNCQVKKSEVCFSSTSLATQTSDSTSAWTVTEGAWTTIRTAGSGLSFTPNVLINSSNALTGKIVFGSTYTVNSSASSGRTKLLTAMNFDLTVFE